MEKTLTDVLCEVSEFGVSMILNVFGLNTGDLQSKSLYAARMRKNKDQKSSKCGHFLRSDVVVKEMFEQKMKKQPLKSVL